MNNPKEEAKSINREIIFRAKRVDNGQWVEGLYYQTSISAYISTIEEDFKIYLNTLGQYTGLKDRDGNRIFEGDVLSVLVENPYTKPRLLKGEVEITKYGIAFGLGYVYDHEKEVKIIGNRWDNPELLQ